MIEAELGRFGDKRLACVGGALLRSMQSKRTFCVHRLGKDRNQTVQFGNLLANRAVTTHEMLVTAGRLTNQRAAGRHVLAIMDTTDLRFPTHEASKRGFGRDANDTCPGVFLHPVLTVDAGNGGVVGLLDCVVLNRTGGKVTDHKKRAADDKESRRWLHSAEIAGDRLTQAAMITMVGDRESDIYDLFARRPQCAFAVPLGASTRHDNGWPAAKSRRLRSRGVRRSRCRRRVVRRPPGDGGGSLGAIELKRRCAPEPEINQAGSRFGWSMSARSTRQGRGAAALAPADNARGRDVGGGAPDHHLVSHALDYRAGVPVVEIALPGHRGSQMEEAAGFKLAVVALIAAVRAMQLVLARDGTTGQPVADAVAAADMAALRQLNVRWKVALRSSKTRTTIRSRWYAWIVHDWEDGPVIPRADTSAGQRHASWAHQGQICRGWKSEM